MASRSRGRGRNGGGGSAAGDVIGFCVLAVVVLGGSLAAGYYLSGGTHPVGPPPTPAATVSATNDDTPPPAPAAAPKPTVDQDYTAPDAPRIAIQEVKQKPATQASADTDQTDQSKQSDPEASQQGSTTAPPDNSDTSGLTSPVTSATTAPSSTDTDQDYETTGTTPSPTATGAQEAAVPGGLYRVQVGSFVYARNAHAFANALRNRGYTASTVADHDGGATVYHVQTGAFRTEEAAGRARDELQRYGFPAFVAPVDQ